MATLFPSTAVEKKVIEVYSDADWAGDTRSRKSTSGAVILAGGCRLHAHSRGQDVVALSSCEAELYGASEAMKEAVLLREMLMFIRMGEYAIELKLDAKSTHQMLYRRGPGRMKHLDVRALWLQELAANHGMITKKIPREINAGDLLTHPPSKAELDLFTGMINMRVLSEEESYRTSSKRRAVALKGPVSTMVSVLTCGTMVGRVASTALQIQQQDVDAIDDKKINWYLILMFLMVMILAVRGLVAFWGDLKSLCCKGMKPKKKEERVPDVVPSPDLRKRALASSLPTRICVTATGDRYHAETCHHARTATRKMLKPCKDCRRDHITMEWSGT